MEGPESRALGGREDATVVHLVDFEISYEPMPDPAVEALPQAERDRIMELSEQLYENPRGAPLVAELESLVEQHPDIPMLRNHLACALGAAKEDERAKGMIAEIVRLFPRYVYGFATHIAMLLRDRKIDEARLLLEDGPRGPLMLIAQFDPTRRVFHSSEVVCYTAVVAQYLAATDRLEAAWDHFEMCREVDAEHPQVKALEDRIILETFMKAAKSFQDGGKGRRGRKKKK
jgi:hypothetical protein